VAFVLGSRKSCCLLDPSSRSGGLSPGSHNVTLDQGKMKKRRALRRNIFACRPKEAAFAPLKYASQGQLQASRCDGLFKPGNGPEDPIKIRRGGGII
jgi:hypothetical protein